MQPLRHSALRIFFLCLVCIIGSTLQAKSADSERDRCFFSFHAEADTDFTFLFAAKDSKNHYRLHFDSEKNRLLLLKVIHGVQQPLDSAATPDAFQKVGVWLLPGDIRIELDNRLVLVNGDRQFRSPRHSLQVAGALIGPVSVVNEFPPFRENFDDHQTVRVLWETLAGKWDFEAPLEESAQQAGGKPMHSYWRAASEGMNLAMAEKTVTDSRVSVLLQCNAAQKAGIAFNIVDKDTYSALVLAPGEERAGALQLLSVDKGEVQHLAEATRLDIHSDQWYRLIVETHGDEAWCSIVGLTGEEQLVFGGIRTPASSGAAGTVAEKLGAVFEDFLIQPSEVTANGFDVTNRWKISDDLETEGNRLTGTGFARLGSWIESPNRIDADVHCPLGKAAIYTHSPNSNSYYAFGLFDGELQFRRILNSQPAILARQKVENPGDCHLTLIEDRGLFRCQANGREVFRVSDTILPEYGGGLLAENARLQNFRILQIEQQATAVFDSHFEELTAFDKILGASSYIIPDLFQPSGPEWQFVRHPGKTALFTGKPGEAIYHYDFSGSVSILAEMKIAGGAGLIFKGENGSYSFGFSDDTGAIEICKNEYMLARRPLPKDIVGTATLEFIRRGSMVSGFIDAKPMLKFDDPMPLQAVSPGIMAKEPAEFYRMKISLEDADYSSFALPSPQWRPTSGQWAMHAGKSNLEIDYWISAIPTVQPAWLWNLKNYGGDLELHVTVMPFVKGYADGGSKQFELEDVQFAFCGYLNREKSGYNVVLRPDGRDAIAIFRSDDKVAETPWQHDGKPVRLSITKSAGAITVYANSSAVVSYVDDRPLARGYLGLGVGRSRANFLDLLIIPR